MNARLLASAALAATYCGVLPAKAADSQMLALLMPDAKIVSGVNVQQALGTPFGQFVLAQVAPQDQQIQALTAVLGFDPRLDVLEILAASSGAVPASALTLARGKFDPAKISSTAAAAGAKTEAYGGVTIIEDPQQKSGVAFLDATLAVFGPVQSVKEAIDRRGKPSSLPSSLAALVNQWSSAQDAWAVSILPTTNLKAPAEAARIPGLSQIAATGMVQQIAGGVKFGPTILVTAQAQADSAQNATTLAGVVQLLQNMAQAQAGQDAQAAALLKSVAVTVQGTTVNFTFSATEAQIEGLIKPSPAGAGARQVAPRAPAKKIL